MDQRPLPCRGVSRLFMLLILLAALCTSGGCASALATALWVVKGTNLPADFDGLKEKRVVVVCRPLAGLTYRDSSVAKDLARDMYKLLKENIPKVELVDQRRVDEWIDENTWQEYTDVGKALEADFVIGVDLEGFSIFQGQTVYQGKANVALKVYDCHTDEVVFERRLPQIVYPPNSPRSTGEQQENDFRREYVHVLADQIARHFYPHDPHADFAIDAAYLH